MPTNHLDGVFIPAPIARLKKAEIIWLSQHYCKHSHSFLDHYSCYLKENPLKKRYAYLDIEASNLKADFGICYCYCFKVQGEATILERVITKRELETCLDKDVVRQFIADLLRFDRTYGYYSSRYDLPFMRARALYHGIDFPGYGARYHKDLYFVARSKLSALSSRRLKTVAEVVLGKSQKTVIDPRHWIQAMGGNKKSLDYILKHCRYDVIDLELVHRKLEPFYPENDTSI